MHVARDTLNQECHSEGKKEKINWPHFGSRYIWIQRKEGNGEYCMKIVENKKETFLVDSDEPTEIGETKDRWYKYFTPSDEEELEAKQVGCSGVKKTDCVRTIYPLGVMHKKYYSAINLMSSFGRELHVQQFDTNTLPHRLLGILAWGKLTTSNVYRHYDQNSASVYSLKQNKYCLWITNLHLEWTWS